MLGVCDKIVPGLLIGALSFGHLPTVFVPAGPMPCGLPNAEKSRIRQLLRRGQGRPRGAAGGRARRPTTPPAPAPSTAPRTPTSSCVEAMGLHLPGASFVNPGTAAAPRADRARGARGDARAARRSARSSTSACSSTASSRCSPPAARPTTRCTSWRSRPPPASRSPGTTSPTCPRTSRLLARVYPNGPADINHFHAAGGVPFLIGELLDAGLMHPDVDTVAGFGLGRYRDEPYLDEDDELRWRPAPRDSARRVGPARRRARRSPPTAASACSTARSAAR